MLLLYTLGTGTAILFILSLIRGLKSGNGIVDIIGKTLHTFGFWLIVFTIIVMFSQSALNPTVRYFGHRFTTFSDLMPTPLFALAGFVCRILSAFIPDKSSTN